VEFYAGDRLLAQDRAAPYQYVWAYVASGSYDLRAVAWDLLGGVSTSAVVNVSVTGNYPPVISVGRPANNAVFGAPARIPRTIWF